MQDIGKALTKNILQFFQDATIIKVYNKILPTYVASTQQKQFEIKKSKYVGWRIGLLQEICEYISAVNLTCSTEIISHHLGNRTVLSSL